MVDAHAARGDNALAYGLPSAATPVSFVQPQEFQSTSVCALSDAAPVRGRDVAPEKWARAVPLGLHRVAEVVELGDLSLVRGDAAFTVVAVTSPMVRPMGPPL